MAYTTVYKDIVFVEGDNSQAKRVQPIQTSLGGIGAHFKTLNDVKDNLANLAKLNGCNCVLDFKYGQKTALFAIDDVKYYGSGVSSILPEDTYKEILEKKKKNWQASEKQTIKNRHKRIKVLLYL